MILALILAAGSAGPVPSPVVNLKRVEGVGVISVYNDGGSFGVSLQLDAGVVGAATAPLEINSGTISCVPASGVVGGCLTVGAQEIGGAKTFNAATVFMGNTDNRASAVFRGPLYFIDGAGTSTLTSLAVETGILLQSNKGATSPDSDFQFQTPVSRTAGKLMSVVNNDRTAFYIGQGGSAFTGSGPNPDGGAEPVYGSFVDGSGNSGNVSLTCSTGFYPVIMSRLADRDSKANGCIFGYDAGNPDGGASCAGQEDGGSLCEVCYDYGGFHGGVTVIESRARRAGWGFAYINQLSGTGAATDVRFWVDAYSGAIGQSHGMSLAQFPPAEVGLSILGLYPSFGGGNSFLGTRRSGMIYASDKEDWYYMSGALSTSQFVRMGSKAAAISVRYFPPVLVNTSVTVATLGGFTVSAVPTFTALNMYLSVQGTGGSSNIEFRATNGGAGFCDFTLACNAALGAKRLLGSGSGCTNMLADDAVTLLITSIGDCATPATVLGNITLEGYWQ